MSKYLLKRLTAACALSFLSISRVSAFDLKVVVTDEVTGLKTGDLSLTAHDTKDLSLLGSADFVAADTTFLFRNLPDREVLVMWPEGVDMHSAPARPDMEVLNIKAKIEQETQLKEVVVQGLSRYMTDDGQVYIPSKQERKVARNATALLSLMAIPTLNIDALGGAVSTASGEGVSIYINYMEASAEEVSGLRPMEIEKVEVLDYPKDPRFAGAKHVINYILVEYVYGGFTRLYGDQSIFSDVGNYTLYSKLRYRAMTYDLSGGYGYNVSRHTGSSSEEEYRLTDMSVLRTIDPEHSLMRASAPRANFKATYQGSNSVIANTVGFSWRDTPVNRQRSVTSYTPAVVAGNREERDATNRNMSLSWRGNWQWYLPHSYTLIVNPGVTYGHIKSDSRTMGESYDIVNDAREKNWDFDLRAFLSRQFGQQFFTVGLWGRHINDAIEYSGTSASDMHTRYAHAVATLSGRLQFGKFWTYLYLQGSWARSETNGITSYDRVKPSYQVTLGYNPSRRTQLQLYSILYYTTPQTSDLTPDIFLQTPLFAITGNPYLGETSNNLVNASWTQFLSDIFTMSANVGYYRANNVLCETYDRSEYDGREIIVRSYANWPHMDKLDYGVSLSGRFLSNSLTGTVRVGGQYADRNTISKKSMNTFNYSANLNWMHGNWYVGASYQSSNKTLTETGWSKGLPMYYIGGGWGNGEWNVGVLVINPFTDGWVSSKMCIDSPVYHSLMTSYNWNSHRRIEISASWSISYGKKVDQRMDLNAPAEASSSILR